MTQPQEKSSFIYRVGVVRLIVFVILIIVIAIRTYFFKPKSVEAPTFPPEQLLSDQPLKGGDEGAVNENVSKPECEALIVSGVDTENVYRCASSVEPCSPEQMAYEQCMR